MSISASPGQNVLFGPVISSAGLYVSGITGGSALGQVKIRPTNLRDTSYPARMKALFGSAIIGYYVGGESSDTVAIDDSGNGYHGTYTGVTLGQTGAGDGRTCPLYDGAADYMQPPAGFRNAFTPDAYSILVWVAIASSAVWTDGTADSFVRFEADVDNSTYIRKNTGANELRFQRIAGGLNDFVLDTSLNGSLAFFHAGLTVDVVVDQLKAYINGLQVGNTQTGLGTWVGILNPARTLIGATSTIPIEVANGRLSHVIILNRAATPAEVAAAAVI